nr:putative ribonuclease H-like domain-containing protein [Tanacetum cinerariifolium]
MNQFCDMKGIKREFSFARTPYQNGVAERKNRILLEAARTMLVDSKLPTTFWEEAVNTSWNQNNIVAGQAKKKKEPEQEYILIPICTTDPLISQGPKDTAIDAGKKATEVDES